MATFEERLWSKVDASAGPDACHPWVGATDDHGYGNFYSGNGKFKKAHVVVLELDVGPLPQGVCALHTCDNPPCCNRRHLYPGTKKNNAEDRERGNRGNHATGVRHGCATHPGMRAGSRNGRAKMTEDGVRELRQKNKQGIKKAELARLYGLSKTTVGYIVSGKLWPKVEG